MKTILKLLVIFCFSISAQAQESEPEMRWSKVGRYHNKIKFEVIFIFLNIEAISLYVNIDSANQFVGDKC